MISSDIIFSDLSEMAKDLRDKNQPFAFATIVRTVGATAVKPGAKALLSFDGAVIKGWLGGECARNAVKHATTEALETGVPQLVSVMPTDLKNDKVIDATNEGVIYSSSGCPSRGMIDIFIEPYLPMPELIIIGESPVAVALAQLAQQFHWTVSRHTNQMPTVQSDDRPYIVVATQGKGDLTALKFALKCNAKYRGFVGSKLKFIALSKKMVSEGFSHDKIKTVKAPAGLDINSVTPEEIALSILAELVVIRRRSINTKAVSEFAT